MRAQTPEKIRRLVDERFSKPTLTVPRYVNYTKEEGRKTLVKILAELIGFSGQAKDKVAEYLNTSDRTLSRWIDEERTPTEDQAVEIFKVIQKLTQETLENGFITPFYDYVLVNKDVPEKENAETRYLGNLLCTHCGRFGRDHSSDDVRVCEKAAAVTEAAYQELSTSLNTPLTGSIDFVEGAPTPKYDIRQELMPAVKVGQLFSSVQEPGSNITLYEVPSDSLEELADHMSQNLLFKVSTEQALEHALNAALASHKPRYGESE